MLFDAAYLKRSIKICHDAICYVLQVIGTESVAPVEGALIEAMHAPFPVDHPAEDYDRINHAYDQAMANVYSQFSGDPIYRNADTRNIVAVQEDGKDLAIPEIEMTCCFRLQHKNGMCVLELSIKTLYPIPCFSGRCIINTAI